MNRYEVFGEMISILMKEDGLNLNEAQSVICAYYNIDLKTLRRELLKTRYFNFAYNYIKYNKEKGKFENQIFIINKSKEIIKKLIKRIKKENFSEKDLKKGFKLLLKEKDIEEIFKNK